MTDAIDTAHLANVEIFAGLTQSALQMVSSVASPRRAHKGEYIFRQGEMGGTLYILIDGKVRISRSSTGGEEALAVLEPGASFGEMAIVDQVERSADAIAHEDCYLIAIEEQAFKELLFLHKDLAYEVLWSMVRVLSRRLRATNDKLSFFSLSSRF